MPRQREDMGSFRRVATCPGPSILVPGPKQNMYNPSNYFKAPSLEAQ